MSERFNFAPGRIKFEKVTIKKTAGEADVTNLVGEVNINASILDSTSQMNATFLDAKNLLSKLPIEVGDVIETTIGFPDTQKTFKFLISKIENISDSQKQKAYSVVGISEFAYRSYFENISKAYKGSTSEIALQIFKEYTTEEISIWEESIGQQSLIIPNWSPAKTVLWLAKRSSSPVDGTTKFYFWQGTDQKFNFAPIEKFRDLYKKNPVQKLTYGRNNAMKGQNAAATPNSEASMNTIQEIDYHDAWDVAAFIEKGRAGGRRFVTDLTTKVLNIVEYNYWDSWNNDQSLNGYPSWERNNKMSSGYLQFDQMSTFLVDGIKMNKVSDQSCIRESSFDGSQFVDITINGNQALEVGQVVDIEIPSTEPKSETMDNKLDQRWSGKYYIVAKRDIFTREGYVTALTIGKESLINKEVVG